MNYRGEKNILKKTQEWALYAQTYEYKKQLKSAITIVQGAKDSGLDYVISWSGGKDSTTMTHLVKSVWRECEIMTQFDDCDWPEKKPYIQRVASHFGWIINEVYPDFSVWEYALKHCNLRTEKICSKTHNLTKEAFLKPLETMREKLNCKGTFIGLRKLESKARNINYNVHGHTYKIKTGQVFCMPVIHFEARAIFAYMVSNDIEINPCYFKNIFKAPEEIRLSWALPIPHGQRYGEYEHMRKYYPEHFRKFRNMELVNG